MIARDFNKDTFPCCGREEDVAEGEVISEEPDLWIKCCWVLEVVLRILIVGLYF